MGVEPAMVSSSRQNLFEFAAQLRRQLSPQDIIRHDELLARHTTLRVGGPADLYLEPNSESDLQATLEFCSQNKLPFFVLGRGSNLLVKDGGFRGVAISLAQPAFSRIEVSPPILRCGAGAKLKAVAVEAKRNAITGLEFLEGIPGSVGGALRMNAGAMGGAMFDVVQSVRVMDLRGGTSECKPGELEVKYRGCASFKSLIALSAVLQGRAGVREEIERRMNEFSRKRWSSQPAAPSAGCMFKNPVTVPAGKLIEELGLKGTRVGGAVVSAEHGNFLINDGTATARDVLELIELIRQRARSVRGIELETEVEIIGE
jgi:UDP-N-acetylenolpyruvoylglucosamine reductase